MRQPRHLCGDSCAGFESVEKAFADMRGTADSGKERGLEKAWDAEGGGDEDDTQGGVGTDEKVLFMRC